MAELEVFIDDSGDCETCLSYTALVMIQGSAAKALNDFDAAIDPLVAMFELGNDFELHGSVLLGDTRLAEYQREFPFRHALDRIARFPTLTVATVHWDWSPAAFRKPADPRAWRHRVLWRRLLAMLDEIALAQYDVPCDITAITTDATNNADRILEEHTRYVAARPNTRILSSPVFEDSTTNRLLQAADLCAFSADLWPGLVAETRLRRARLIPGLPSATIGIRSACESGSRTACPTPASENSRARRPQNRRDPERTHRVPWAFQDQLRPQGRRSPVCSP